MAAQPADAQSYHFHRVLAGSLVAGLQGAWCAQPLTGEPPTALRHPAAGSRWRQMPTVKQAEPGRQQGDAEAKEERIHKYEYVQEPS